MTSGCELGQKIASKPVGESPAAAEFESLLELSSEMEFYSSHDSKMVGNFFLIIFNISKRYLPIGTCR